jgi:hypothetical protein
MLMRSFGNSERGLPRGRNNSLVDFAFKSSGNTWAAGCAVLKSDALHSGFSESKSAGWADLFMNLFLPRVGFAQTDHMHEASPGCKNVDRPTQWQTSFFQVSLIFKAIK